MTRQVVIAPALNGFICYVGCQTIVFESAKKMLDELAQYYAAPEAVEGRYLKNAVNQTMQVPQPVPEPRAERSVEQCETASASPSRGHTAGHAC